MSHQRSVDDRQANEPSGIELVLHERVVGCKERGPHHQELDLLRVEQL
jgi:hypothetical protein